MSHTYSTGHTCQLLMTSDILSHPVGFLSLATVELFALGLIFLLSFHSKITQLPYSYWKACFYRPLSMSTHHSLCTSCRQPWITSPHRTCDNCRARRRARYQHQRPDQRHVVTCLPSSHLLLIFNTVLRPPLSHRVHKRGAGWMKFVHLPYHRLYRPCLISPQPFPHTIFPLPGGSHPAEMPVDLLPKLRTRDPLSTTQAYLKNSAHTVVLSTMPLSLIRPTQSDSGAVTVVRRFFLS